jgi:hypothetical protein
MPEFQTRSVDGLPDVDVSLVLIRTGAEAIIRTFGRRKGEKFLREWLTILSDEEKMSVILPIRPTRDRPAVMRARRQALLWLESVQPTLTAAIPPE